MSSMLVYFVQIIYPTKEEKDIPDKKEGRRFQFYIRPVSKSFSVSVLATLKTKLSIEMPQSYTVVAFFSNIWESF